MAHKLNVLHSAAYGAYQQELSMAFSWLLFACCEAIKSRKIMMNMTRCTIFIDRTNRDSQK